jgi:4-alpha-glucanotransferase
VRLLNDDERNAILENTAAAWGIWSRYTDGLGRHIAVAPETIAKLVDALAASGSSAASRKIFVLVHGQRRIEGVDLDPVPAGWEVWIDGRTAGVAHVESDVLLVPGGLPLGIHELRPRGHAGGDAAARATLIVAPAQTYQGPARERVYDWLIAAQLYGVRSHRNWGHGDFTDLSVLLDTASACGAAGIGLNPLHALFDDRPGHISPYSPNSRQFIEPAYIDVERIAEFPGVAALELHSEIERLRSTPLVDYAGVRNAKQRSLRACHRAFRVRADSARRRDFDNFRSERGKPLRRFACFETLRRRFTGPWWKWPAQWRAPDDSQLDSLYKSSPAEVEYHEYVQWIADRQLAACRLRARELGLKVGLYLDLAVGVVPDGADAWMNQSTMLQNVSVGAPPDALNVEGQSWGITSFSPIGLAAHGFEPFRELLSSVMRDAGALRIDHVLGLNRLFIVPRGMSAKEGTYIDFQLEAMLAIVAAQSQRHHCIVIGEDLGTVPDDFRDRMARWGLWSYRVMQFERDWNGRFHPPQCYEERALVTFATHDLPTFASWWSGHDLEVRRSIGHDPGETAEQREAGRIALRQALGGEASWNDGDFAAIARFIAATPSHLVAVSLEDIAGAIEQPNVPGSTDEYPNWRTRLPLAIEELASDRRLADIAAAMHSAGR